MTNLLSADDLKDRGIRLSKSQRNVLIGDGLFPRPIPLGKRTVAWVEAEIDQWIQQRIAERDGVAP